MIGPFHAEPLLAAGYVLLLVAIGAALELLAKHSHRRADRYHTGGFHFHRDRDAWECPAGMALIRAQIDHVRRVVTYRAPAHACNNCPIKSRCTDSDSGREISVALDPWMRSASMRLQRGISLVLLALACFILLIELFRHAHSPEMYLTGSALILVLARLLQASRRMRQIENDSARVGIGGFQIL